VTRRIAVLPLFLIREDLTARHMVRILPAWSGTPIALSAIYVRQRTTPLRVRAFIDYVAEHAQRELDGRLPND
jgi:DNA-binding transcriptional LysR family regulator